MKETTRSILARLADAARRAEPEPPAEPPAFLATRVLATVREREADWFWWEPFARSAAVAGCALALAVWLVRPGTPIPSDEPSDLAAAFLASELQP